MSERTLFCLKCGVRVDLEKDIGAVELQRSQGAICGKDVDKLIAEIWTPRATTTFGHMPKSLHPSHRLPGEAKGEYL